MIRDSLHRRERPKPTEPLLPNARGQRYTRTALTQLIYWIAQAAGITRIQVRAHVLRHTANYLAKLGIDIHTRSRLLTHSGLRSQMAYEHIIPAELSQARERQRAELGRWLDSVTRSCHEPDTIPPKLV